MPPILTEQFAYHGSSGYYFNNNKWGQDAGSGGQSLHVDRTASHGSADGVAWHIDWSWEGGEHNVKSYPYSGRELPNKKLVSEIGSIPTSAEWSYRGSNLRANVAYDLFTAAESDRDTSGGDYELMIW